MPAVDQQHPGAADATGLGQPAPTRAHLLRRLLPLIVLLAGTIAFFAFGGHRVLTFEALRTHRAELTGFVQDNYVAALLVVPLVYAVATALSLPLAWLLTPLCGFLFGAGIGSAIAVIGATLGAIAIFLAARSAFAALFRARAGGRLQRMEEGFRRSAFSYLLFLRLVPLFPFWLVNVVPALFRMPLGPFALATVLGIVPGAVVYASLGSGLGEVLDRGETPNWNIIWQPAILLPILGLAILALVPALYTRWKARKAGA